MTRRTLVAALLVAVCAVVGSLPRAAAGTRWSLVTVARLPGAVDVVERTPGDGFIYVVSRNGTIERWSKKGKRLGRVLDVRRLTTTDGERGLLGLAFRAWDGRWEAFVNYTDTAGDTVIARWAVRADGTFVRQPRGIPSVILRIAQPYPNHNGGAVRVGPDNMVYVGTGDGGSAGDPQRRALDTSTLLGKMLRIDPHHVSDGRGGAYDIPAGNPYPAPARAEIWSIGLRNPWRFSFDAAGNLWVADVGQDRREEASFSPAAGGFAGGRRTNFGWSAWEGTLVFNTDVTAMGSVRPFLEYDRTGGACSISGGAVTTAANLPGRAGRYLYGDYCAGWVRAVRTDGRGSGVPETVGKNLGNVTSVAATSTGVWVVTLDGRVRRVSYRG